MKKKDLKKLKECRENIEWEAFETIVDFITYFDFLTKDEMH